jgi:predicted  nucleic acid-binding Zn-ribbon protein
MVDVTVVTRKEFGQVKDAINKLQVRSEMTHRQLTDLTVTVSELAESYADFRGEMYAFRDEMYGFRDEMYAFRDEMYAFRSEMYAFRDQTNQRFDAIDRRFDSLEKTLLGAILSLRPSS